MKFRNDVYKNFLQMFLGHTKESKETWFKNESIWIEVTYILFLKNFQECKKIYSYFSGYRG